MTRGVAPEGWAYCLGCLKLLPISPSYTSLDQRYPIVEHVTIAETRHRAMLREGAATLAEARRIRALRRKPSTFEQTAIGL